MKRTVRDWMSELSKHPYGRAFVDAMKNAMDEGALVLDFAFPSPQWVLNAPLDIPDSVRRWVAKWCRNQTHQAIAVYLNDILSVGISYGALFKAVEEIAQNHHTSVQKCAEAIAENPYLLGQALSLPELAELDTKYANEPRLEDKRVRGFFVAACKHVWQSGDAVIRIAKTSRAVRLAAEYLGRSDGKTETYVKRITENWKTIYPADERLDTPCPAVHQELGGKLRLYPRWAYWSEIQATEAIVEHLRRQPFALPSDWDHIVKKLSLDPSQKDALAAMWVQPITFVTGGPGTGKTTLVKALADMTREIGLGDALIGLAPTGLAAKRLRDIAGIPASTIHSMFHLHTPATHVQRGSFQASGKDQWVIVDEASMCDLQSFHAVVWSTLEHPYLRVVFIGDANQLPPVGFGQPFRACLSHPAVSEMVRKLFVTHRTGGVLVEVTSRFWEQDEPWTWHPPEVEAITVKQDTEDHWRQAVMQWIEAHGGPDSMDWLILTPFRQSSDTRSIGQQEINSWFLENGVTWRIGMRIVQNTNNYMIGRQNGEMGVLVDVKAGVLTALFDDGTVTKLDEMDAIDEWSPAYALTIHKAQGGERTHVLVVMPEPYDDPRALYTALTRAKKSVTVMAKNPDEIIRLARAAKVPPADARLSRRLSSTLDRYMQRKGEILAPAAVEWVEDVTNA